MTLTFNLVDLIVLSPIVIVIVIGIFCTVKGLKIENVDKDWASKCAYFGIFSIFGGLLITVIGYITYFGQYVPYSRLPVEWKELVWNTSGMSYNSPQSIEKSHKIFEKWKSIHSDPSKLSSDQFKIVSNFLNKHIDISGIRQFADSSQKEEAVEYERITE